MINSFIPTTMSHFLGVKHTVQEFTKHRKAEHIVLAVKELQLEGNLNSCVWYASICAQEHVYLKQVLPKASLASFWNSSV